MAKKFEYLVLREARGEIERSLTQVSRAGNNSSKTFSRAIESAFPGKKIPFHRNKCNYVSRNTSSGKIRLTEVLFSRRCSHTQRLE